MSTDIDKPADPQERWTSGTSIDGKGTFSFVNAEAHGQEPKLGMAKVPEVHAQKEQMQAANGTDGTDTEESHKPLIDTVKDAL